MAVAVEAGHPVVQTLTPNSALQLQQEPHLLHVKPRTAGLERQGCWGLQGSWETQLSGGSWIVFPLGQPRCQKFMAKRALNSQHMAATSPDVLVEMT